MSQVLHREGPMPESLIACYAAQLLEVENNGVEVGRLEGFGRRGVDFFVFR